MGDRTNSNVLGVVVCDFERSAIGTRSRLCEPFGSGTDTVVQAVIRRLAQVKGVGEIAVVIPGGPIGAVPMSLLNAIPTTIPLRIVTCQPRPAGMSQRVRIGRAWNLHAWRGGAGQWTAFDEEYHPAGVAAACAQAFGGAAGADGSPSGADHVLFVHSHGIFLDVDIAGMLVDHHLHKNHEMRVTYTPAAPGLCGMALRADIVREMGDKNVMPWQLLGYDPKAPSFDTLIREACMQVDPALSKIPNRFCVDTQRAWDICKEMENHRLKSAADLCLAAASAVAPGVRNMPREWPWPREVEIELTGKRLTTPPGSVPREVREARRELDATRWIDWFARQGDLRSNKHPHAGCDDLLLTVGGDGDPLLYGKSGDLAAILRAARAAGVLSICVQTDLLGGNDESGIDSFLACIQEGLVDVVTITMYGHTAQRYAAVAHGARPGSAPANLNLHEILQKHLAALAQSTQPRGGIPLVIPRLLKVRETIGEMEAFFDFWVERCGWAVIDGPTDRAGAVEFQGVVSMAPPKRRACRRLWDRLVIRANGLAGACDQDMHGKLDAGHIDTMGIQAMWHHLHDLRNKHASGQWNDLNPCHNCQEWHRA